MTAPSVDQERQLPMPDRRISEFRPEDAAAVAVMLNDSDAGWPGGLTGGVPMTAERVLQRQSERPPLVTFVAWEGTVVAGFVTFYEHPDEAGSSGYVGLLNVATSFQGRGYGRDLLASCLERSRALGYRRIDLGTWAGNMKAVPLYKKSGYFWVPESSVHMENYIPLLLSIPALADFWADADWYRSQVRDLSVREDLFLDGKMRIYPYEFRHGDRFVRATIDATARDVTALETEQWRVSCTVEDRTLIAGKPQTVRWEVENRTGHPLPFTLLANPSAGLRLAKEVSVTVQDRYQTEAILITGLDFQQPGSGERGPRIDSLVVLDGQALRLATGLVVRPPITLRLDPERAVLAPGQQREFHLLLTNAMDEMVQAQLTLTPSPGLQLEHGEARTLDLTIEAESYAGATLHLTAATPGAHALELQGTVQVAGETITLAPQRLQLPAPAPGQPVSFIADASADGEEDELPGDREVHLVTLTQRLLVRLREGTFRLEDAASGDYLAGGMLVVGPPFSWSNQARVRHEPTIELCGGSPAVVLRGQVPHAPGMVIEHELRLMADGLLRLQTSFANAGQEARAGQGSVWLWTDRERLPMVAMPTRHGTVTSTNVEFPDWGDLALRSASNFAEGWIARQNDSQVAALLWGKAGTVELDRWAYQVFQEAATLAPGDAHTLEPLYIYAAAGNWRTARAQWRALFRPEAPQHAARPRDVLALTAHTIAGVLLTGTPNEVTLDSVANREERGELVIASPEGWEVSPDHQQVDSLAIEHPHAARISVLKIDGQPGAARVQARLRGERADWQVFDGALMKLGSATGTVGIEEEHLYGQRVLVVDNGYLRFRLAPDFLASIINLETVADGTNHLCSAYPEAREYGWMRPWYGGIFAAIYKPGPGRFADAAKLYQESFEVEQAEEAGHDGRVWRGLAVRSRLQGRGLRGLELCASYLTLPGSNLLAARVMVRNHTSATLPLEAALAAYLQPDGTVRRSELLIEGHGDHHRLLRAQRTEEVPSVDWVGVRNGQSGRTVALVCGAPEARVVGIDYGELGANAGIRFALQPGPGEERGARAFLAIARDEAEARAYRSLAGAQELP